jgi:hypothetical protein
MRSEQVTIPENSRQYRKGGNAEASAQKQSKAAKRYAAVGEEWIQIDGKDCADCHWRRDTGVADEQRNFSLMLPLPQVQFETNHEHEQKQAQLARGLQNAETGKGKESSGEAGRRPARQRRSEQNAGETTLTSLFASAVTGESPSWRSFRGQFRWIPFD